MLKYTDMVDMNCTLAVGCFVNKIRDIGFYGFM